MISSFRRSGQASVAACYSIFQLRGKASLRFYSRFTIRGLSLSLFAVAREEAGTAINGAALRWIKGHCRLLSALRALHCHFDSLAYTGCLRGSDRRQTFVLGLLAGLTPLGFVLQILVVKKDLLASRPDEILAAVYAFDRAVFKLRLSL